MEEPHVVCEMSKNPRKCWGPQLPKPLLLRLLLLLYDYIIVIMFPPAGHVPMFIVNYRRPWQKNTHTDV